MESPNRYSTSWRVASWRMAASSPRMISTCRSEIPATSPLMSSSTGALPGRSMTTSSVLVRAASTWGRIPVRSATSTAGPNRSTACPPRPARRAGARSTTVGVKPWRRSQ